MYVDFAVNNNGDIMFSECNTDYSTLNLKFTLSNTKTQKITFAIDKVQEVGHLSDDYMKISFMLKNNDKTFSTMVYKGDEALAQLIALQLKSTLGELLYRTDDGSKLSLFKHENINPTTLSILETYLTNYLQDYLYNPIVKATPNIDYKNGYKQVVELNIYNDENLLLQYNLEG